MILRKDFISNFSKHLKSTPYNYSLGIYFTIFISISLIYSQLFTPQGTFGYILIGLLIYSLLFYLYLFNYSSKFINSSNLIISYIISSTFIICIIGLIAQLFILLQLFSCNSFSIFHPEGDIHCVPIGLTTIYRFSIGSNINEFSFYILISYILLDQREDLIEFPSFLKMLKNKKLIKSTFLLCGVLALSRAWIIGILFYYLINIFINIFNAVITKKTNISGFSLNLKKINLFKLIFYSLIFTILLEIFRRFYEYIQYILSSRYQFLLDPQLILEGSSSLSRLELLERYQDLISRIGFLPILAPGSGTGFHNSFLQLALEVGLPCASFGLFLLLMLIIKKPKFGIPPLIFMASHHILYNPIMWLYFWSISNMKENKLLTSKDNIIDE
tara:strand:- start:5 stop:1165 length:1161 start_codon:yes stop_codon:yes gene_type:complete